MACTGAQACRRDAVEGTRLRSAAPTPRSLQRASSATSIQEAPLAALAPFGRWDCREDGGRTRDRTLDLSRV